MITPAQAQYQARADGIQAQSPHFELISEVPVDAQSALSDIEYMRAAIYADLGMVDAQSSSPLTISLVRDPSLLSAIATSENIGGLYQRSAIGPDIIIGPSVFRDGQVDPDALRLVLRHEVVHHILETDYSRRLPLWIVEGLAEYYATFESLGQEQITFGKIQPGQMSPVHADRGPGNSEQDSFIRKMIEGLSAYPDFRGTLPGPASTAQQLYYSQSRILAQYIMERPDGLARVHRFVDGWTTGTDSEQSFANSFGVDYSELADKIGRKFEQVRSLTLSHQTPEITTQPLKSIELNRNQLRLLLTHGRITDATLDQIDQIDQFERDDTSSHHSSDLSLILARSLHAWRLEDWDAADQFADQALKSDPENKAAILMRVKTAYGRVTERQSNPALWQDAERATKRALALSPRDPELHLFRVAVSLPQRRALPRSAIRSLDWLETQSIHKRYPRLSLMMFSALIHEGRLDYAETILDNAERWASTRSDRHAVERLRVRIIAERDTQSDGTQ